MERSKSKAKGRSDKLFRFQSFTERIASIKIDVVHQTRTTSTDAPDESETFFGTALHKWRELNCTSSFVQFHGKVVSCSKSLPQLVHHKDEILTALLDHLQSSDTLAHEPLLDLVVQLARDIQSDFYPHFTSVFPVLVSVCLCHDPQLIQDGFSAIAHIFKFLWRHMLRDIENVYSLYSELLVQSQKSHIRQFAAESFGFLLRKVRDQEKLLGMIFTSLSDNPELVEGVGQLIFEVCKGVPRQFHSCTEKVLQSSLEHMTSSSSPRPLSHDLVFATLSHTVQLMAEHTRRDFSSPLWSPILSCLNGLVRLWKACPESVPLSRNLDHVLHLVGVAVAWHKGSRIKDSGRIVEILEEVLSPSFSVADSLLSTALHLVTSLVLVGPHVPECHAHSPGLLRLLCSRGRCEEVETVLKCFRELSEKHPSFLTNILPDCVKYCDRACESRENHTHIIHFLAELCLAFDPKWARPESGTPAGNFRTPQPPSSGGQNFTLQLEWGEGGGGRVLRSGSGVCGLKQLVTALQGVVVGGYGMVGVVSGEGVESEESGRGCGDLANTWAALVCAQHLSSVPSMLCEEVNKLLWNLTHSLQKTTPTSNQDHTHCQQLLMVWSQAVCTLTSSGRPLPLPWDHILPLLQCWRSSPNVLTAVERYLNRLPVSSPLPPLRLLFRPHNCRHFVISSLFSFPTSVGLALMYVRVLTLKVIKRCLSRDTSNAGCDATDTSNAESDVTAEDSGSSRLVELVEICLKAEQPPAILTEIPLRFLIGSLYVNLSLLWEPIKHLIISYAVDERKKLFWEIFGHFLERSSNISEVQNTTAPPSESHNWHDSIPALFRFQYGLVCGMERGRPDHVNFRRLLWGILSDIPSFAEPRSRTLVPLFLQFIEKEYALRVDNLMEFQDLRCSSENDDFEEEEEREERAKDEEEEKEITAETEVEDVAMEVEEEEGREKEMRGGENKTADTKSRRKKKETTEKKQSGGRGLTKVFSKFTNPKVLYRQEDLHNLYMKLLTHRDTEVQELAIDCLLTYKAPYLVPYHENLGRLMENASFREELLNFNTDSDNCVVAEEHRTGLLPILLRILYGRIQRPVGVAMSRVGVASRRMAVLQFLAGCEERDIDEFFSLLLLPFRTLLDSSEDEERLLEVDIGRVIPLRKQLGFVRMLSMILAVLGPRVEPHLPTFLSLLLGLAHIYRTILDHSRHLIQPVFVTVIKTLRQLVVVRLIECFKTFTNYDFSPFEDKIFGTIVWPQLVRLPSESIQHPTPLMRLLSAWSKFQRYHKLLGRSVPKDLQPASPQESNISSGGQKFTLGVPPILHYVYQCLFSPGVSVKVAGCVMEMTLDLLECAGEEGGRGEVGERGGEGVRLVLAHVPTLLAYLGGRVRSKYERTAEGEGGNLQLEFTVLSRISTHVNDSEECATLGSLLLPFVSAHKYRKQQESVLVTLKNLLASIRDTSSFFRPLSKFFGELTSRQNRKLLCETFQVLAEKDAKWKRTADIVSMVNKWDSRHIEEPAYETRQEGYADASELLSSETSWTVDCVLPILHNAIYTLNMSSEMSLRDAASSFVTCLLSHVGTDAGEKFHYLVMNVVVTAVKKGLRSGQEFARLEYISVLSSLVKYYPLHPRFVDMATHLANEDKEADFFENVRHLQLHRHTKAMRKLATACKCGQLSPHSMTGFLVPLANQVLFHSTSNVEQNLVTESVNVISGMCLQLKWTKYCYFLRHYLRLLTKKSDVHKTLIRVVVGILDSFHFDVCGASSGTLGKREKEEGKERGREEQEEIKEGEEEKGENEEEEEMSPSLTLQQKIHDTIVKTIIPSLAAVLTKGSSPTPAHKLSSKSNDHEANVLRVPVAMAMTKLLLHLPQSTLITHLPSLLLKVCEILRSRSQDARGAARDTLVKMAAALGPAFLPYIFKEMKDLLTRGYQLHVLGYSLHSILNGVCPILKTGDLDPSLDLVSQVLVEDLFGVPAEEREAGESVAKIPEGKNPQSSKSFEAKASSRTSRVAEEVLRQIGYGILSNDGLTPQALLVFVHGLVSDAVPRLLTTKPHPPHVATTMHSSAPRRPEDCRLIPREPGRARPKPASQSNVAIHVITEFGLQVLRTAFKKGKFDSSSTEQLQMLDPFLPLLTLSLASRHTKVLTHSLHCLLPLLRLSLPSLDGSVNLVVAALFGVLRKYARSGEMSGTNRELVVAAFKAMTVVLREVKQSQISEDELKLLLSYVEEDIHDYRRQITAFPLLRAILGRKFVVEDIHKLMYKVAQLSVTSDSDTTRLQCRQAVVHYVMDYPLGKKLKKILDFYVCNLSYEDQNGRESVVEFFSLIFSKFPDLLIRRYASFFFLPLSAQLANDDSSTVKRMITQTLSSLFKRLNSAAMNDVIAMVKTWLSHTQLSHKKLAVQLVGILTESQGRPFEAHLPTFLPLLSHSLLLQHQYPVDGEELISMATNEPVSMVTEESVSVESGAMEMGRVSKETKNGTEGNGSDNEEGLTVEDEIENETRAPDERSLDHFLFGVVTVLSKLLTTCGALRSPLHQTLVTSTMATIGVCITEWSKNGSGRICPAVSCFATLLQCSGASTNHIHAAQLVVVHPKKCMIIEVVSIA
ncbi:Small subunit processome component 20 homolog [Geodia barretti]|uniref:Small subunit processome component 20 homolog n=1 Tax=Geodia barretti TaxID=519541 RepID=A0AA35SM53_GEOBA|nr:Small subunit processome component 20 homolog [Geodia barretti]